jgi:4-amino-4-deoxy-L-arabinose transferase-like glycosyltransferase
MTVHMGNPVAKWAGSLRWRAWSPGLTSVGWVLLLGGVVRLAWLWLFSDHPLWLDEAEYVALAQTLRGGGYVDDFLWLRVPLYPLWLALLLGPGESLLLARLGQLGLGLLVVYQLYRIALVVWHDRRVALVGALGAALYLPLVAYSFYLMAEMLLLALLCAYLLVLLRVAQQATARRVALAALLLALAVLTKPVAAACAPALLVALWFGGQSWRQRLGKAVLALLVGLLLIGPWAVRNTLVHGHVIVLDTTGGFNAWFGNSELERDPFFERDVYATYANLAERDRAFAARAWENIAREPAAALAGFGEKLVRFWRLEADVLATRDFGELALPCTASRPAPSHGILTPSDVAAHEAARFCPQQWINLAADIIYLPLLLGLVVGVLYRQSAPFAQIGWSWLVPLYLITVLTVVQPRLRLPLLPIMLPWSAAGLVLLWDARARWRQRAGWRHLARRGAAIAVVLVGLWLLRVPALLGSQAHLLRGYAAWSSGAAESAHQAFRSAAHWYPERIGTLVAAGQAAETLGHDQAALAWYQAASADVSYEPHARIGAARILARRGDTSAADTELDQLLMSDARAEAWAFAAPIIPSRTRLDLGAPTTAASYGYQVGWYPRAGEAPAFRPSGAEAALRFGTLPSPAAIVRLHLSGARPAGAELAQMQLDMPQAARAQIEVAPHWRTYHILVPPAPHGVELTMQVNTFIPATLDPASTDTRPYGLALSWAALEYVHPPIRTTDRSAHYHDGSATRNKSHTFRAEPYTRRTEE